MPFGIPSLDEAASLLEGAVQDNENDLANVGSQIIQAIGQPILDNRAALNTIQGRFRSSLGKSAQVIDRHIDTVGNTIDTLLGNAISSNMAMLPQVMPGSPVPPVESRPPPLNIPGQPPGTMPVAPPSGVSSLPLTMAPPLRREGDICAEIGDWFIVSNGYWVRSADLGEPLLIWYGPGLVNLSLPAQYANGASAAVVAPGAVPAGWKSSVAICLDKCPDGRGPVGFPCTQTQPPQSLPLPPPIQPPAGPPAGPPAQPAPPAPTPPAPGQAPPVPTCSGLIPPIGSKEFCDAIPQIKQMLHDLGDGIIAWLTYSIVPSVDVTAGQSTGAQILGALNPLASTIGPAVLQTIIDAGSEYAKSLSQKIDELKSMFACVSSCDVPALFSVAVVKTAIRLLRNFRVGTDLGVWATVDATFEIQQIEQIIDYVQNYICPAEIPSIGETMDAFTRGFIQLDQYHCWMMMRGADPQTWLPVLRTRRERLLPEEAIQYSRRVGADDQFLNDMLLHQGWTHSDDRAEKIYLYDKLPTIGDHLHWLQKNVFSTEYVQQYHLLDGFAPDGVIRQLPGFETYTSLAIPARGYFWDKYGKDLWAQGMKPEYAAQHYAAHWIMPSPEQMKQFVYRLRPGRVAPGHEFTLEDYNRVLTENDYNVLARQWFVDTANPVPAISYIKRMFQLGVINDAELKAYHKDLGYKDLDADNFVGVDKVDKARHLATSGHGWTPQAMASAYAVGQLTADQVTNGMAALSFPPEYATQLMARATMEFDRAVLTRARSRALYQIATTVKQAIAAGTMSAVSGSAALQKMGWPQTWSDAIAGLADVAASANLTKAAVTAIRSAYLHGQIVIEEAGNRLTALGLVPTRINQLLQIWQIQNTPNRKRRTSAQIVADVSTGHVSIEEGLARLTNLGYEDADRQLFLADAQGKAAKMAASKQLANLKAGRAKSAELAKLARQAQSAARQAISRLKGLEPVAHLQKWLRLGIIDEQYFNGRMAIYGYSPGETAAYQAEALSQKGKAGTKPQATSPGG